MRVQVSGPDVAVVDLSFPGWRLLAGLAPARGLILQASNSAHQSMSARGWKSIDRFLAARPETTFRLYSSSGPFHQLNGLPTLENLKYLDVADAVLSSDLPVRQVADCFPRLLGARIGYARGLLAERCKELVRVRELEIHGRGWQLHQIASPDLRALSLESMSRSSVRELTRHPKLSHLRIRAVRGLRIAEPSVTFPALTSLTLEDLAVTTDNLPWVSELESLVFLAADNVSWERIPDLERIAGLEYVYLERNRRLTSLAGLRHATISKLALIDQGGLPAEESVAVLKKLDRLSSLRLGLSDEQQENWIRAQVGVPERGDWKFAGYVSPWLGA